MICVVRFRNWFHTTSDGNFHATDKNKLIDLTDFPMSLGAAYFADERDYKVFVTHAKPQKEVSYPDNLVRLPADLVRAQLVLNSVRWDTRDMEDAFVEPLV